jgi:CheY-like chemotaxis protein
VAEDNPVNRKVAAHLLERLGYVADVVDDGRQAVEAHARGDYAAILMDCQMPELDGFEATAVIRGREADGRRTPIIALTAAAMRGDRERCLAAGMDDYITKPIRIEALAELLRRWVDPTSLDQAALDRLADPDLGGSPEFLGELIDLFLAETPAYLARLRTVVAAADPAGLARAAHSLKGSAANLGATELQERCGQLERLGRSGSLAGADELLAGLLDDYRRVESALRARRDAGERAA